jgi:maltoporin
MNPRSTLALSRLGAAAITCLAACGTAQAMDYSGYFRGGPGLTSGNASRACYDLGKGSKGMKYRLGNECDFYGEFQFVQGFNKDGIEYSANLMLNHWNGATDTDDKGLLIEQMWAEAKGFDIAPNATFWIGKERGRRGDVHIVDTFFTEMAGVGAGFKNQPVGAGKLGVAFYKTDSNATQPGNRLNVEYGGLKVNDGGELLIVGTATKGDFTGGTSGTALSLRHSQSKFLGTALNNDLWLQIAQGSAGLNSNFGDLTASSAAKSWRIVDSINGQSGALGGQAMLLLASQKDSAGVATDSLSLGGRVSYGVTKNFKFVTELGYSQAKPQGGQTAKLTKLTLAPTLAVDSGFWSRPEFRLYVTHASWNAAAGNVTGQAAYVGKTSGTSYGAQIEWWF